eukprot:TRINITY_DN32330_c0_g1_i1.p2 TRINITY_DN32330_c0_g1~~TRINITY_DN32330_c0_g1_i1.p2  ORF type:complete len:343 (+),score=105.89 TRINITY_DN32330_c0_g1_i1:76-1029(+)
MGAGGMGGGEADPKRQATTPVVLFNNLPTVTDTQGQRVITTHSLFTLCGMYGDVVRVRFLNQPTQALVELASVRQAETARVHLDKLPLYDTLVRCYGATNDRVVGGGKGGKGGYDPYGFYEYTGSKLHRFNNPKSYDNIASPKPSLIVWGHPDGYPEADLLAVFLNYGTIEQYKEVRAGPMPMLQVQLESTDQAAVTLLNLHDLPITLGDRHQNLRLNFAKENLHAPAADHEVAMFNVMLKGLPEDFTNEELYEVIAPFGNPKRYTVWKDKTTGRGRGFALVDYSSAEEAKAMIMGLNGHILPGRQIPLTATSKYVH